VRATSTLDSTGAALLRRKRGRNGKGVAPCALEGSCVIRRAIVYNVVFEFRAAVARRCMLESSCARLVSAIGRDSACHDYRMRLSGRQSGFGFERDRTPAQRRGRVLRRDRTFGLVCGGAIASARPRTSIARGRHGSVLSRSSMTIAARRRRSHRAHPRGRRRRRNALRGRPRAGGHDLDAARACAG
jgi:hypothetical protein